MNEVAIRERAARAKAAQGAMTPFIESAKEELVAKWMATEPSDTAGREAIWNRLKALDDVSQLLTSAIAGASRLDASERTRDILTGKRT